MRKQKFILEIFCTVVRGPSFSKTQKIPFLPITFFSLHSLFFAIQGAACNVGLQKDLCKGS